MCVHPMSINISTLYMVFCILFFYISYLGDDFIWYWAASFLKCCKKYYNIYFFLLTDVSKSVGLVLKEWNCGVRQYMCFLFWYILTNLPPKKCDPFTLIPAVYQSIFFLTFLLTQPRYVTELTTSSFCVSSIYAKWSFCVILANFQKRNCGFLDNGALLTSPFNI